MAPGVGLEPTTDRLTADSLPLSYPERETGDNGPFASLLLRALTSRTDVLLSSRARRA